MPVTHLTIDDRWIANTACLRRRVHPPLIRPEPVLKADKPWERRGVLLYGSVCFDTALGRFRMWYKSLDRERQARVSYAESEDGLIWDKPDLGICEFDGSTANNIVFSPPCQFDGPCIIFDADQTDMPYRMVYHLFPKDDRPHSLYSATSKDGLHWQASDNPFLPGTHSDRQSTMAYRDRHGRFVVYVREADSLRDHKERIVCRTTSKDFIHWTEPKVVFKSMLDDPDEMQAYSLIPFECQGMTLGLYERMHVEPDVLDTELVMSYDDGETWQAIYPRTTFLPRGGEDSWRSGWISAANNPPVEHDGQLHWFVSGRTGAHQMNSLSQEPLKAIGLATSRIDGFGSLTAGEMAGWVRTRPFICDGSELTINADTRSSLSRDPRHYIGRITAAIRDESGEAVEGLTHKASDGFGGDTQGRQAAMKWGGEASLSRIKGRRVSVELRMERAHLYAIGLPEEA